MADLRRRARAWWIRHKGSVAWVALLVIAAVGFFQVQSLADSTNNALCDLRGDLERRVESSEEFLEHPEDFPAFNDPKTLALIRQQVEGQHSTIAALGDLSC